MKRSLWLLMLFLLAGHVPAASADSACEGRFVNPITDICWSCIFPLSLGSIKVSQGKVPDTANPSMPIQICPAPPPLFWRIGLAIGYWEPMALTDVTRSPGCMVNLGFSLPAFGKTAQGTAKKDEKQVNGAFYHVHWYKYPLTYWLNIITSLGCLEGGDLDIAYLSEIDPTWTDSSLTTILNPEAVIFANPIAQGACAADAIASAFNMPLDVLFWCAGSQGSMYPFNGWVSNESSPLQSSLLVSERMAFKLHRQGMIMETIGKNNAVCNEYPSPILPKERWRYQMVNMYPDSGQCHPFGRSVTRWETGKNPPNTKKNFGYLMWRKRNCVEEMKMATMDSKYIQHLRKISAVLLRLISRTLKLFPFGLVMVPVILFYFAPDSFLAEIIHEWKKADISEQVTLVRLYLKVTFTCAFVAVFLNYLFSDEFMPVNSRK